MATDLGTRGVVAMSGNFGYELDITKLPESEKEIIKSKIVIATLKNYFMESTSSTDYFYDCYEYERTSSN